MEGADLEKEEEPALVVGFAMEDVVAKYEVAQAAEMAEQTTILESIQDETYVESNRRFIPQEEAETDAHLDELEAEMEAEAATETTKELELRLSPMYPKPGTETVDISGGE
jgi:hypothetical protein